MRVRINHLFIKDPFLYIENGKKVYEFSNILFDAKGRQSNKPLVGMYVCNFYGMFNHAYQKVCVCVCEKPKQVSVMRSCMAFFDDIKKLFTSIHKLFLLPFIIIIFLCCSSERLTHKHRTQFNSQHFIIQCKHKCLNMKEKKEKRKNVGM